MKIRSTLAALAAMLTTAAMGATTWYYGASDNSASFGATPDSSQAITWMDAWAWAGAPNSTFSGSVSLQSNRPSQFGIDQGIMMYGFGGIATPAADISSAVLYLVQDYSSTNQTWNIVGIAPGNANWDNGAMTWNDIDGAGAGDWTGGNLVGSLSGNYGSFGTTGLSTDTNITVDITSALKAYRDGAITGIAFVNSTNGITPTGADNRFIPYSNDNTTASLRPGLLVTAIPEPSAALLGALGSLCLLRRRRQAGKQQQTTP